MTDKAEWLAGLKAGDPVIVQTSHFASKGWLSTVDRLTATQIVVETGERFQRIGGDKVGRRQRDYGNWLEEPTKERRDAIKHQALVDQLKPIRWEELPLATLQSVAELVHGEGKVGR